MTLAKKFRFKAASNSETLYTATLMGDGQYEVTWQFYDHTHRAKYTVSDADSRIRSGDWLIKEVLIPGDEPEVKKSIDIPYIQKFVEEFPCLYVSIGNGCLALHNEQGQAFFAKTTEELEVLLHYAAGLYRFKQE